MKIEINKPQAQGLKVDGKDAIGFWGPTFEHKEEFKARGYKFMEFTISKWFEKRGIMGQHLAVKGWVKVSSDTKTELDWAKTLKPTKSLTMVI